MKRYHEFQQIQLKQRLQHNELPITSDETWQPSDTVAMEVGDAGAAGLEDSSTSVASRGPYIERIKLPNFSMECDIYGVSLKAAAAIASALMKDLDIKDKNDETLIIDKNKVQRERNLCRNDNLRKRFDASTLIAFAFCSRRKQTKEKNNHLIVLISSALKKIEVANFKMIL